MKHLIFIVLLFTHIFAFTQDSTEFEYLTMTKLKTSLYLTIGTDTFEEIDLKKEVDNKEYDLRPIHKRIEEFEQEGWEFVSGGASVTGGQYYLTNYTFLMRRKK